MVNVWRCLGFCFSLNFSDWTWSPPNTFCLWIHYFFNIHAYRDNGHAEQCCSAYELTICGSSKPNKHVRVCNTIVVPNRTQWVYNNNILIAMFADTVVVVNAQQRPKHDKPLCRDRGNHIHYRHLHVVISSHSRPRRCSG